MSLYKISSGNLLLKMVLEHFACVISFLQKFIGNYFNALVAVRNKVSSFLRS